MRSQLCAKYFMGRPPIQLTVLICCATMYGVLGMMEHRAYGASASEKAEVKPPSTVVSTGPSGKPLLIRKGQLSAPRGGKMSKNKKPSDRQARKALRGRKPMPAEVVPESTPGLAHHGLLREPHRYHLNQRDWRSSVVAPPSGDLVQDHFLELDKNRDGVLDPLERAVGRLDIERDMSNR